MAGGAVGHWRRVGGTFAGFAVGLPLAGLWPVSWLAVGTLARAATQRSPRLGQAAFRLGLLFVLPSSSSIKRMTGARPSVGSLDPHHAVDRILDQVLDLLDATRLRNGLSISALRMARISFLRAWACLGRKAGGGRRAK